MPRDEMRQPLKRLSLAQRLWRRRPAPLPAAAWGLAGVFLAGTLVLPRIPAPGAGEPVVMAEIPAAAEIVTSSIDSAPEEKPAAGDTAADNPEDVIDENAGSIDPGEDQPAAEPRGEQAAMVIVAPHRPLKKAPIDAVTEKTDQGPLPRVLDQGKRPFDAYSQVTPTAALTSGRPRITLVLGGMGLNPALTKKAIADLPGDVTLGFAPYGEDLQAQVNAARAAGHEILLQVPMEPLGYPGNNPGPGTLLSDAKPADNLKSLKWLMSRFAGYSGITNYMGGRLLSSEEALAPIMKELKARGLVYLEDASVNLTLSPKVGQELRLPMQRASMLIDAEPTEPAIRAALDALEKQAQENGSAIATGSGLEVTIETVAEWAKTLQEKGMILVPVSAAYKGRAT